MTYNENSFQTAVEILIPLKFRTSEVRLVVDGNKKKGDGRFGFFDILVDGDSDMIYSTVIIGIKIHWFSWPLQRKKSRY